MSYDLRRLKTISVADGEVAVRIPQRWTVHPSETWDGYWGCYEEGEEHTGTLWIQVDRFESANQEDILTRESVERLATERKAESPSPLESKVTPVRGGYYWFLVYDGEEDGEPLRFWFSRFFLGRGTQTAVISFNFVLAHDQMEKPEFVQLREIMDREVRGAFFDLFRFADEEEAEKVFGPLQRVSFADQVKLVVPEAMECSPNGGADGNAENQWYCRLDAQTSHAGMFVMMDEFPFSENDAAAIETLETSLEEDLSRSLDRSPEDNPVRRAPRGTVLYHVFDDDDAAEGLADPDDPPLRNHVWTYVYSGGGGPRRLQVLLMIPVSEVDTVPVPQLVSYMDGAVRRAEFPGTD